MGFGVEAKQNSALVSQRGRLYELRAAMDNRYIHFTVRRTCTNHHKINVNAPNMGNVGGQQ
jgi:hypothetical protein